MTAAAGAGPPLLVSFGALGDCILVTGFLAALAETWAQPCDVLVKRGPAVDLLAGLPAVGEVRALRSRRTPTWLSAERRQVVRWLRARRRGPVYLPDEIAQRQVERLLAEGGIGEAEVVSCQTVPRGDLEHKLDHLQRFGRVVPPAYAGSPGIAEGLSLLPALPVAPAEVEQTRQLLRGHGWAGEDLVLFQTRSRNLQRGRWGDARWAAAMRDILGAKSGARGVLLGSAAERTEVAKLREHLPDLPVWNLAGELSIPRLLGLLALAHSCVSLDSGPAHAAAAVGCPLVVVLGRGDPRRNAPRSARAPVRVVSAWPPSAWPATRRNWEVTHRMDQVRVEAVVNAWRSLAAVPPPGARPAGDRGCS